MCIKYKNLDAVTLRDAYQLSWMYDCIDFRVKATKFSEMDANLRYLVMLVAEKDNKNTTLISHAATFRFNLMRLEHIYTFAKFQRTLTIILNKYTWKYYLMSIEMIFSKYNDRHLKDIVKVLATLYAVVVLLKLQMCNRTVVKLEYLLRTIIPHKITRKRHTKMVSKT